VSATDIHEIALAHPDVRALVLRIRGLNDAAHMRHIQQMQSALTDDERIQVQAIVAEQTAALTNRLNGMELQ
jgi:hypothetical protein